MPYILESQNINKENYKIEPIKWGNVNIVALKRFWEENDPTTPFFEKQLEAHDKFIRGILTDDIALVTEALKTNLINAAFGASVITDDENEFERCRNFTFTDALREHPVVAKYVEDIYNKTIQKSYLFIPPNIINQKTEFAKMPGLFKEQYVVVPKEKIEYINIPFMLDKIKIIGIRKTEGFSNSGLDEFVKGIIIGNFNMVKFAVEKYNINPRLIVPLVSENMNEIWLNPIYEAKTRGYKEIEQYLNEIIEIKKKESAERGQKLKQKELNIKGYLMGSNDYISFITPLKWTTVCDERKSILGVCKTNLRVNCCEVPLGECKENLKIFEKAKNEKFLIKGILTNDVELVKIALNSKLIDKNLLINIIVNDRFCSKTQSFNAIYEALRKNNQEIISLLRQYQNED